MAALADKTGGRVLVVDDEAALLKTFRYCLEDEGHSVATAASGEQAMALIHSRVFDVCFLDLSLGDSNALELLPAIRTAAPWLRVVIVTAHSSVDTAVQAMRAGATDYLVKPCSPEQLRIAAATHLHARRLDLRLEELERETGRSGTTELESRSPAMAALLDTVRQVAESEASILVLGESGTGKGVIAKAIHRWSARRAAPFITINSPGLSAELFESELFGHRKGAFTGAIANSPGRVSQADGGTLFLDEIGEVPLALQPKLLRFLQDKQFESVGDPVTRQADVRLVAATNRDLNAMVRAGTFREDLL
ncbi:MAG: sigma-54 dependent transcriptional regulator, partial [Nevskia sp.]|nr:sigma-54 dependent transcriptional regulator [Nevskia sp.]